MKTIAVIAPANTMADLPKEIRTIGVANLNALGYDVRFGDNVDNRTYHTAGTAYQRLADFNAAIDDKKIDVIMPVFGGYNSNQLLHRLDYGKIAAAQKTVIGFSDITGLLMAINKHAKTPAIHGPSFSVFCDPNLFEYTRNAFVSAMRGDRIVYESPEFTADDAWFLKKGFGPRKKLPFNGWQVYVAGTASGKLIGGNLETMLALSGTSYFPEMNDHILFVEDASGNNPGAFHRGLTQLSQMGILNTIQGLIIGKMPSQSKLIDEDWLRYILDDVLGERPYPIVYNVNCSHTDPVMSLPFEADTLLEATSTPRLTVNSRF